MTLGTHGGHSSPSALRPQRVLVEHFKVLLSLAAEERNQRREVVGTWPDCQLGWVVYERETMFAEVNRLRAVGQADPVELVDVRRVETSAEGHCDYVAKYALGCVKLVLDGLDTDTQGRIARSR